MLIDLEADSQIKNDVHFFVKLPVPINGFAGAPQVSIMPEVVNFVTGDTVNITCTSVAYPPPSYVWERHGRILPITEAVSYDPQGQLTILSATRSDEGEYTCVATNVAGVGTGKIRLNYIGLWPCVPYRACGNFKRGHSKFTFLSVKRCLWSKSFLYLFFLI